MEGITKLGVTELRKGLQGLSHQELVDLLIKCSGLSKEVKNLLAVRFKGRDATDELHQRYRKRIEEEFFPGRGDGKLRLGEARKAIREFEEISGDRKLTFDLMLFYVETGVRYAVEYEDVNEKFYVSMESMFAEVVRWLNKEEGPELYIDYGHELYDVVENAADAFWYFFHEDLLELYYAIKWVDEEDGEDEDEDDEEWGDEGDYEDDEELEENEEYSEDEEEDELEVYEEYDKE